MPTRCLGGASYFVTFIDDTTMKVWVYPVELEKGKKLNALCSDNGCEYISHEFGVFCKYR